MERKTDKRREREREDVEKKKSAGWESSRYLPVSKVLGRIQHGESILREVCILESRIGLSIQNAQALRGGPTGQQAGEGGREGPRGGGGMKAREQARQTDRQRERKKGDRNRRKGEEESNF